jgi:hypothetical protein
VVRSKNALTGEPLYGAPPLTFTLDARYALGPGSLGLLYQHRARDAIGRASRKSSALRWIWSISTTACRWASAGTCSSTPAMRSTRTTSQRRRAVGARAGAQHRVQPALVELLTLVDVVGRSL